MSRSAAREEQRDRLLEAALAHIPFDGWSSRALMAGARDLGIDPDLARRLFPRGGDDLLAHIEPWADRRMAERVDSEELATMRVRDRIAALIRARLAVLDPHREAMRRAVAARLLPGNAFSAAAALWRTVDLMWSLAGDHERDASWYSKRAILSGVWSTTFLYWLDDRSLDGEATSAFLERRIDQSLSLGRLGARLGGLAGGLSRLFPSRRRRGGAETASW